MKSFYLIILTAFIFSCSKKTDHSSDGLAVRDSIAFIDESDSTNVMVAELEDVSVALQTLIQKQKTSTYHLLQLSASGHEYKTEAIWSFDSLLTLVHCHQKWTSEGIEGETHYFFKQDKLYAFHDETFYDQRKDVMMFHSELGGVMLSGKQFDDKDSASIVPLQRKYLVDSELDQKKQLSEVVNLINENKKKITEGNPAMVNVKNKTADGIEISEITIDVNLLEKLLL